MKSAYLAICYSCNENCQYCPCSNNDKESLWITPLEQVRVVIQKLSDKGDKYLTISGGEPTTHPNLIQIIQYAQKYGMDVTVLSNGERFSDNNFQETFIKSIDKSKIKIITTLHSHISSEHERANLTPGSFERSINGLLNLQRNEIRIIVKHCITKENYRDLTDFYYFIDETFNKNVELQLCSIDYVGIPKDKREKEMLPFYELRPYFEKMLDANVIDARKGKCRRITCINMPLCSCDPYYWKTYMRKDTGKMYSEYDDPHSEVIIEGKRNAGPDEVICRNCIVREICSGTYYSAFQYFGDRIVKPYLR